MVDCLASTGMDPFVPFVIAALLVLAGIGAAIVAWRRGHAGAALMIGLVLVIAPLSFGAPQSASAADDCSGSSQSGDSAPAAAPAPAESTEPTAPVCDRTPAVAVADVAIDGGYWQYENGFWNLPLPTDGTGQEYSDYMSAMMAISEIDRGAAPVSYVLVAHDREGVELTRITITPEDFGGTGDGGGFDDALFDRVTANGSPRDIVMEYTLGYSDGCGGTLDTTIAVKGLLPPP